jgi:hypothetical protein
MKIHYLGHILSREGIDMDIVKVEDIMEWPSLKKIQEVCSFMGLPGYY